jgi:hypothetical protein
MTVRAGGHQISGLSIADGALLLDLGRMNGVQVDEKTRRVTVEVRTRDCSSLSRLLSLRFALLLSSLLSALFFARCPSAGAHGCHIYYT